MTKIKFGTDGWRAIIAKEFTVYNVARVSKGLADWLNNRGKDAKVVLGHDCRFGGALFTEVVAKVLCANGVKVIMAKGFISTPMISFGVLKLGAQQGVVITASHNPPSYNGYKLKGAHGGPSSPLDIAAVENLIPEEVDVPAFDAREQHLVQHSARAFDVRKHEVEPTPHEHETLLPRPISMGERLLYSRCEAHGKRGA